MTTAATGPKTRLGEILESEGRRQSWLARAAGLDASLLSRYVNGLHCPEDRQRAIAEALGRNVEDVFPTNGSAG